LSGGPKGKPPWLPVLLPKALLADRQEHRPPFYSPSLLSSSRYCSYSSLLNQSTSGLPPVTTRNGSLPIWPIPTRQGSVGKSHWMATVKRRYGPPSSMPESSAWVTWPGVSLGTPENYQCLYPFNFGFSFFPGEAFSFYYYRSLVLLFATIRNILRIFSRLAEPPSFAFTANGRYRPKP
jgi:hypothetical protein